MIDLHYPFRAATLNDASAMAELVNIAGEGLPYYLWTQMAEPGQSAWDVGHNRARRDTGGFSYRNTILMEGDGQVIGCLIGYPLSDEPDLVNYEELPPMFVSMQQLEDLAPGTWYVNVLAVYPEYRSQGHGTDLLSVAERVARQHDMRGLSLIVSDANTGARRLYNRYEYEERAQRPMIKEGWENPGQNWVLLVKDL